MPMCQGDAQKRHKSNTAINEIVVDGRRYQLVPAAATQPAPAPPPIVYEPIKIEHAIVKAEPIIKAEQPPPLMPSRYVLPAF